mmetsp:Transcript_10771/g.26106  ORF Transcript_10771/g.26106 Transcript_10771/m.26106 type:complete len:228 (+) Transcript_10771:193-876(+)
MVCILWAMVRTVHDLNSSRMVVCMSASVLWSTAEVASSRRMIFERRSSALPRHSSCLWPCEKFLPPSSTTEDRPSGRDETKSDRCERRRACHTSSSLCRANGSMLKRTEPVKRTGSCGMMLNCFLRSSSPILVHSMPSTSMYPAVGSTSRSNTCINVDLPAPVLPTIPIFWPPSMVTVSPFRTRGSPGRYLTWRFLRDSLPFWGQSDGGRLPSTTSAASCGRVVAYS